MTILYTIKNDRNIPLFMPLKILKYKKKICIFNKDILFLVIKNILKENENILKNIIV